MLLKLSLLVGVGYATIGDEVNALRDDVVHVCMKLYGGSAHLKNCRSITDSGPDAIFRHSTMDCWKSGWSGRGNLKCKYGADVFNSVGAGNNLNNPNMEAACVGCQQSRRRMEIDDEDIFGEDAAGKETTEESEWEEHTGPVNFSLENIEDEAEVVSLGNVSTCILQGFEYYKPDSKDVRSKCVVSQDSDGKWELTYASAKCDVTCFPHNTSRFF